MDNFDLMRDGKEEEEYNNIIQIVEVNRDADPLEKNGNILNPKEPHNFIAQEQNKKKKDIQITRGDDTYSLPEVLAAHKDATKFLGNRFSKDASRYIGKAAYKQDTELIKKYYDRTRMDVKLSYKERAKKENDLINAEIYKLGTDKKFGINGDNKEMRELKTKLTILQNVLCGDIQQYKKEITKQEPDKNGEMKEVKRTVVDAAKFGDTISAAFSTTIEACDNYINTHQNPKSWWGKRRKRRAIRLKQYLLREQFKYKASVKSLESNAYEGGLFSGLKTPQDLVEKLDIINIESAVLQKQGNSTNVYIVQVEEQDENMNTVLRTYYMKENLPLINQNISSFLDRRTEELTVSKNHMHNKTGKEELRLNTAKIDDTDYDNGLGLLNIMRGKISSAGLAGEEDVKKHYVEFFRHDFDSLFKELRLYNANVEQVNKLIDEGNNINVEEWEKKAALDPVAAVIYEALKNRKVNDAHEKLNKETPFSWIVKKLNLDENNDMDKEIVELLRRMENEQPVNTKVTGEQQEGEQQEGEQIEALSRIETMFRITMGKEVELFGQMMEGDQAGENEMSQYNTMVTSYLAKRYGFKEVVDTSMRNANFTRDNETKASGAPVTLQEVAPGDEWIEVIKETRDKKPNVMIRQSSNSVRQLVRLQMFDTVCLQKDRHGRNFKCKHKTNEEENVEVIDDIKAYDHDQSFYSSLMKEAFKEKRDAKGNLTETKKNRFLPSQFKVVKKGSTMYKYIAKKYFNKDVRNSDWVNKIKEPTFKMNNWKTKGEEHEFKLNSWMKDQVFLSLLGAKKDKNGNKVFERSADFDGYIKKLEKDEDISVTDRKFEKYIVRRDNPNEKIVPGTATYLKVLKQLNDIVQDVADFYLLEEPDHEYAEKKRQERMKNPNMRFKDDEIWQSDLYINRNPDLKKLPKLAERMAELQELSETYDLTNMYILFPGAFDLNLMSSCERVLPNGETEMVNKDYGFEFDYDILTRMTGNVAEAWVKQMLYTFAKSYGNNPNIQADLSTVGKPKEFEKLENENGDIVVPGLLHADFEAKQALEKIVHDFEHGNIREIMLQEQMTEDAVTATYERAKENLVRLEEMRIKAEIFLNSMYAELPKDDPHRKFYLTKEEFDLFDDLSEFAVDPGDSYLVQDNEHFLACQEDYQQFMTEEEKQSALDERNAVLTDSKRWKDKKIDHLSTNISSSIHKKNGQAANKNWQHFKMNLVDREKEDHLDENKAKFRKDKLHDLQLAELNKDLIDLKKDKETFFKTKLEIMKMRRDRNEAVKAAIKKSKVKRWADCDKIIKPYDEKASDLNQNLTIGYGNLFLDSKNEYAWMDEYKEHERDAREQKEKIDKLDRLYDEELTKLKEDFVVEFLKEPIEKARAYYEKEMKPLILKWNDFYTKYRDMKDNVDSLKSKMGPYEWSPSLSDEQRKEYENLKKNYEDAKKELEPYTAEREAMINQMKEVFDFDFDQEYMQGYKIQAVLRRKFLPEDLEYYEKSGFDDALEEDAKWGAKALQKYGKKKTKKNYYY